MTKKEFDIKKKLIELQHDFKMEEIKFKFEKEKEIQRIRSAEIKKSIERKQFGRY